MLVVTRGKAVASVAATVAIALSLSACSQKKATGASTPRSTGVANTSSVPSSAGSAAPAVLTISPAKDAGEVSPVAPIKVAVAGGQLASVSLTSATGTKVKGALATGNTSWASAEPLGYGKQYSLTATATNPDGKQITESRTFSTVEPRLMTMPYIQTAAGGAVAPGVTFGVGQVIRIHFDEAIPDRKAAQAALSVQTVPAQVGGFSWLSNTDVYWRTQTYLKAGTKVTIKASIYGKNLGNSLYGQSDASTWFKVGDKHVSIADDNTKQVLVYSNDKLVKTMPTSMGRHVSIPGDTGPIDLRTNSGPHVVVGGEKNINMNSASFGLSKGANAYKTTVPVGVRISYDGEYVHWADWSVWAQGNTDTSHGCLNVSPANAYWFYDFSLPGDIVDVRNTGRTLAEWNSGYWNVSWLSWVADGA
ncbi:MAG: Ig-like domain-containing protein [Jatrophihabitantaceae bacterium]